MKISDINITRKGEKETMEKEKKQIKISLWTFYVLVAGIVILIGAIIIGGMNVKKKMDNLEQGQASLANKVVQEEKNETAETPDKVENVSKNDVNAVKEENFEDVTFDDKDVQKCLEYLRINDTQSDTLLSDDNILASLYYEARNNNNKLTTQNISNDLILSIATNYAYSKLAASENKNIVIDNIKQFSENEIEEYIEKIFGKKISYKHQDFKNGIQFYGEYPTFNKAQYNSYQESYIIDEVIGNLDSSPVVNLYTEKAQIQKSTNDIILTIPVAFEIANAAEDYGAEEYCRVDYYKDFEITVEKNLKTEEGYWNVERIVKNLIAHNYYGIMSYIDINGESVEPEEYERLKQELAVNDGLGTIEENMDKLHKIKMTFTKDDTNEYHFESFEIID